jgi:hypothetical protein
MSEKVKTGGGQAFPTDGEYSGYVAGATLRDYFAARAPVDVPDWFEHISPPKEFPKAPRWDEVPTEEGQEMVKAWLDDACDLPPYLQWFEEQHRENREGQKQWEKDDKAQRFFAWRWYYGEMMVKTRQQGGGDNG